MENDNYKFRFPILDGGRKQGINDSGIATFDGADLYNNLAREICQNSLDAVLDDSKSVRVSFNFKYIDKSDFYCFDDLKKIILQCEDYYKDYKDEKVDEFINEALELLSNDKIPVLVISDYNTKGLAGSRENKDAWEALTSSSGITSKSDGSGGSYGIGKNAPFACSILRTVFYNTYSYDDHEKAFQGVASLMTHRDDDGNETQSCGFFQNINDRKPLFEEDDCTIKNIVQRNEYGTDIIIFGFRNCENLLQLMESALLKNFYVAICNNMLVVDVDGEEINSSNIIDISKKLMSLEENKDDIELLKVNNYLNILLNQENKKTFSILEEDDLEVYIGLFEGAYRTISYVRRTGMSIRNRTKKVMKSYDAVVIARGKKMNSILKRIEPPKHDRWDPKILKNKDEQLNAHSLITKIGMHVNAYIDEICKSDDSQEIDPDGISTFLPDDIDSYGGDNKESKDLETTIVISQPKVRKVSENSKKTQGSFGQGLAKSGQVNNDTSGGTQAGSIPPSDGEYGSGAAIVPNDNGIKKLQVTTYKVFRLIPLNQNYGIYKLIILNNEMDTKISLHFSSIGEDGNQEKIKIIGINTNGHFEPVNAYDTPEIKISKNVQSSISVRLNTSERIRINVGGIIYE